MSDNSHSIGGVLQMEL